MIDYITPPAGKIEINGITMSHCRSGGGDPVFVMFLHVMMKFVLLHWFIDSNTMQKRTSDNIAEKRTTKEKRTENPTTVYIICNRFSYVEYIHNVDL